MTRITFIEVVLVATPFLLFFVYRALVARRRSETGEAVDETPYQALFLAGSAMALAGLVVAVLSHLGEGSCGGSRDQVYIPARSVGGVVEKGYCLSREEAVARGLVKDRSSNRDFDPEASRDAEGSPEDAGPEQSEP